ncbi:MAG: discoidin domain-containing protein [Phycisphaerae bacterium]|nr:discoidin domain-containing protein [Phycisphaerae bacterium]
MCKKLIWLACSVVVLALASNASADLVSHWKFDDGGGNTAIDSSGNDHHGTLFTGREPGGTLSHNPTWVKGKFGGAINFEAGGYVAIDMSYKATGLKEVSVAAWIRTSNAGWQYIISFDRNEYYRLEVNGSGAGPGQIGWDVFTDAGQLNYGSVTRVDDGEWHHACGVFDNGTATIYIDGSPEPSKSMGRTYGSGNIRYGFIGKNSEANGFNSPTPSNNPVDGDILDGDLDDLRIYDNALTEKEIAQVIRGIPPGLASEPNPVKEATNVPRDVVLGWLPGEFASQHDVYFGTRFEDVNNATAMVDPVGVYKGRQYLSGYVGGTLDFEQTYYWRIDEVNAAPDYTVFKGDVWSFTVEPFATPIPSEGITVTASSANRADEGCENTIDGSGLGDDDLHSSENTAMWLSSIIDPDTAWIQYEFDRTRKLHQMLVWNYNSSVEPVVGFGIKEATIEYSVDGANWSILGTTHEFAKGIGVAGYGPNTTVDLSGVAAKYVRITANSNWGGFVHQYGLSEVRFFYVPVWAAEPSPNSGAIGVDVDVTLGFRAGREAAEHNVYFSTDEQAVIDGTAPVTTVTEAGYSPSLDLNSTYYWRVDEVNDAETPTTWQGDIWDLSTQEYLSVDDFEAYNEIPVGEEGSNLVYETWIDGFGVTTNGSTIGYTEAFQPSMEKFLAFDGKQSVPLFYDNTAAAYSEVTASITDLEVGRDWTKHGIKALTLRFSGDPTNTAQRMYVKINGTKVTYDGSAEAIKQAGWQMWYIDLASMGVSLSNVTELSIGFERIGAFGGQGVVLLDGIRLYSYDRQVITPVDPGTTGLQAHYEFEGTTNDSSGNSRHGTHGAAMSNPGFEAGRIGQAISFGGLNDYVNIDGYKGITATNDLQPAFSVTCWVKTTAAEGDMVSWGSSEGSPAGGQYCTFRLNQAALLVEHGGGSSLGGSTPVNDGEWHHAALTVVEGGNLRVPNTIVYVDGQQDMVLSGSSSIYNLTPDADVNIGRRASHRDRYFDGSLDDVRIYNRVLSKEEIAWLAGWTEPFDKPF